MTPPETLAFFVPLTVRRIRDKIEQTPTAILSERIDEALARDDFTGAILHAFEADRRAAFVALQEAEDGD